MKKPKFMNSAEQSEPEGPKFNRYGLSEMEWNALTPEQRIIHYERHKPKDCDHPFVYQHTDELLFDAQSHDPYHNTPHMRPHSIELFYKGQCECQTCVGGYGIPRDEQPRKVNAAALLEKLTKVLNTTPGGNG